MKTKEGKTRVKLALEDLRKLLKEEDGRDDETGGSWEPSIEELTSTIIEQDIADDEIDGWLKDQGVTNPETVKDVHSDLETKKEIIKGILDSWKRRFESGEFSRDFIKSKLKVMRDEIVSPSKGSIRWIDVAAVRGLTKMLDETPVTPTPADEPIEVVDDDGEGSKPENWDELLDDIFSWYQMESNAFTPVMVKWGRKFRGLGYILSYKANYGRYMGRSFETMVYKVWDPKNKCLGEFNTNMINVFADTEGRHRDKWDTTVEVDDDQMFDDFTEYFMSLVNRAKERCGTDYGHMKNYLAACTRFDSDRRTRSGLPENLLNTLIEFIKNPARKPRCL